VSLTSLSSPVPSAITSASYSTERVEGRARSTISSVYWSPERTDVMRWVLKPSQCIRPT
jgi:hypothetical protein